MLCGATIMVLSYGFTSYGDHHAGVASRLAAAMLLRGTRRYEAIFS